MKKFSILFLLLSTNTFADDATYSDHWQYNNNVEIERVFNHWNQGSSHIKLSNGEHCYIPASEEKLFSVILTMRAQNASGKFICEKDPSSSIDGNQSRKLHRIDY